MSENSTAFPRLFAPGRIAHLKLRNRIVLAALSTNSAHQDGFVTSDTIEFYRVRAKGGVALTVVEGSRVQRNASGIARSLGIWDDRFIPGMARLAKIIRENGSGAFLQLSHGGPKCPSRWNGGVQPVSASEVALLEGEPPRPLNGEEIHQVVFDFGRAAVRAREAGFDGVEVEGAHFYLLSAFSSPHTNHRTDAYGGPVEHRARLVCEVVRAVKVSAGADFPVLVKINVREDLPDGLTLEEAVKIARALEAEGVDGIETTSYLSRHTKRTAPMFTVQVTSMGTARDPVAMNADFAAELRKHLRTPVICVGRITGPDVAETVLRNAKADFVAMGRALIVDPYLPRKAAEGRSDEIVPCTASLYCYMRLMQGLELRCSLNQNLYGEPKYHERLFANRRLLKTFREAKTTATEEKCDTPGNGRHVWTSRTAKRDGTRPKAED